MKISKIQTQIVRLPADEALAGGPAESGATRNIVTLRVQTDAGVEGIGYTFFAAIASVRKGSSPTVRTPSASTACLSAPVSAAPKKV